MPITVQPLSRVRSHRLRWLWKPRLPRGKLALLDGDPGVGKSLVTTDLAARLTRGGPLPCGSRLARPLTVLLLNAEDAAADTTRPRAAAAGADLDRLHIVSPDGLRLPDAIPDLEAAVTELRADLLVIDPLMAFLPPGVAANLDQCVRTALTPLALMAERTDCAVLLVRHLRKKGGPALRRGQGSMGIVGAARTALLAGRHPADPTLGVLAVAKANVTAVVPALGYRILTGPDGVPVVEWTGPVDLTADAVDGPAARELPLKERAAVWLANELRSGPKPAAEVLRTAAEAGIPEKTVQRAKQAVRVESKRVVANGKTEWYWYDPSAPFPPDAPFKKPFELPPLPDLEPLG